MELEENVSRDAHENSLTPKSLSLGLVYDEDAPPESTQTLRNTIALYVPVRPKLKYKLTA